MLKQLKQKSLRSVLATVIISLCVAAFMLYMSNFYMLFGGPKDANTASPHDLVGQYVSYEAWLLYDVYAHTTETSDTNPTPKVVSCEYVTWVGGDENGNFMGLVVEKPDIDTMDTLLEESFAYLDGGALPTTTMPLTGTILPMDEESLDFFYETVGYNEADSDAEYKAQFAPYYLKKDFLGTRSFGTCISFGVLGVIALLFALWMFFYALSGGYQRQIKSYIKKSQDPERTLELLEDWYQNAEDINGVRFGPQWTLYATGTSTGVLDTADIVWAYQRRVAHRTNFITTHTAYYLVLRTGGGKRHEVSMSKEDMVSEVLGYIQSNYPDVVLGYDDSMEKLYKKDPINFRYSMMQTADATEA